MVRTLWAWTSLILMVSALFIFGPGQVDAFDVDAVSPAQRRTPTATPSPTPRTLGATSGGLGSVIASSPTFTLIETQFFRAIIPAAWIDSEQEIDESEGTFTYTAAPDLEDLQDLTGDQGVILVVQTIRERVDPAEVLGSFQMPSDTCTLAEQAETFHSFGGVTYDGMYHEWRQCPYADGSLYGLIVQSDEVDAAIFAIFLAPTAGDSVSFDIFRNTLSITEAPPLDAPVRPSTPPTREQATPTPIPAQPSAVAENIAIVVPDRLNVRSGPGTHYDRVTAVERGEVLTILGRNADCSWLKIITGDAVEGWVAGAAQFVTFGAACDTLPLVALPAPPTALPTTPPTATSLSPTAAPTATPDANANLGCYLFENQIGVEVTITLTRRNSSWNTTFRVPRNGAEVRCFEPGDYTYTLDAPPPWDSVNGDLRVVAGERILFPIQAE